MKHLSMMRAVCLFTSKSIHPSILLLLQQQVFWLVGGVADLGELLVEPLSKVFLENGLNQEWSVLYLEVPLPSSRQLLVIELSSESLRLQNFRCRKQSVLVFDLMSYFWFVSSPSQTSSGEWRYPWSVIREYMASFWKVTTKKWLFLNMTAISPGFILERIWKIPYSVAWEAVWLYQTEILSLRFEPETHLKKTLRKIMFFRNLILPQREFIKQ